MSSATSEKSLARAPQQRDDAFDRKFGIDRRTKLARLGKMPEQAPPGVDLARLGQLHAYHAGIAPDNAATADARVEYRVPTPRHNATLARKHHNTVTIGRTWNLFNFG